MASVWWAAKCMCTQPKRELAYNEKEILIYIGTLHKDLLLATDKCLAYSSLRTGHLKSVVKAVFGDS